MWVMPKRPACLLAGGWGRVHFANLAAPGPLWVRVKGQKSPAGQLEKRATFCSS